MLEVVLAEDATTFRANSGEVFILGSICALPLFFSEDGATFTELQLRSFSGSLTVHTITYVNPENKENGEVRRNEDHLFWKEKVFLNSVPMKEIVVQIPSHHVLSDSDEGSK